MAISLLSVSLIGDAACGQEQAPGGEAAALPIEPVPSQLKVKLVAGAWLPRLGGEVQLGPSPAADEISIEDDFELDSSEALLNLELSIRKDDRWQLNLSGFDFSTEERGSFPETAVFGSLSLDPGDAFESQFDMTTFALELAWWGADRLIKNPRNPRGSTTTFRFAPAVGVRYLDLAQRVMVAGEGVEDVDGAWVSPYAAVHLALEYDTPDGFPIVDRFVMDGTIGFGPALGGDGGTMTHLGVSLTAFCTHNLGLTFGYRLMNVGVETSDDYEVDAGLQGLFIAGTLEF